MSNTVSNLDEQVREALRSRIVSGDLSGGAHLSELKLSKEFNVSRTPIREALCALAADGLIEMVPHRGAFVRTINETEQKDSLFIYGQLVSLATRTAVERSSIETLMDLETMLASFPTTNTTDFVKYAEGVVAAIIEIAQSPALVKAINTVERSMTTSSLWLNNNQDMDAIRQEFTYLIGAFKRQKADVAEKTMRNIMALFHKVESASETEALLMAEQAQKEMLNA